MVDRCRSIKIEAPYEGGTQLDLLPVDLNPNQDGLDARAFFAQSNTSADSTAYVSRAAAGNDLTLTDANAGTKVLSDLVSRSLGAVAAHQSLIDLVHLLEDGGPADGWASGTNLRLNYQGALLLNKTWYTSTAASAVKIVSCTYTYQTGTPLVATKVWTLYSTTGAVVRTLTDTIQRSGILITGVVRTWT